MYSKQETIQPFWGKQSKSASGRDPLAIQNSSTTIYSNLIIGITNVTIRIRYHGFYCWVLHQFLNDKQIKKKNSEKEQLLYIRRAELLVAAMMNHVYPEKTGINGSDYPSKIKGEKIDLKKGADWSKEAGEGYQLYWNTRQGVFGQNFIGVLRTLDLVYFPQDDINIFTLTKRGEELASVFEESIHITTGQLFWSILKEGYTFKDELQKLNSFSLAHIPLDTPESEFYQEMLLADDTKRLESSQHRKNSILLLLGFLSQEKEPVQYISNSFLAYNYHRHIALDELNEQTSTFWYLYEISELLHESFEYFHASFLYSLDQTPLFVNKIINQLKKGVIEILEEDGIAIKETSISDYYHLLEKNENDTYGYYGEMQKAFKKSNLPYCLVLATNTILSIYMDCNKHLEILDKYAKLPKNNFNRQGYAIPLFEILITSKWEKNIIDYIEDILVYAINQHTFSSYQKTRIGQGLVHNYMMEEGFAWRLRNTTPGRTSPRLQNVIQYMKDIGLVDKKDKKYSINKQGLKLLHEHET